MEHDEQVVLCRWLDAVGVGYFSVPNAIHPAAGPAWRNRLRTEGLRSGAPDLILVERAPIDGKSVAIEMKRCDVSQSAVSEKQCNMHGTMRAGGWHVIIGLGAEDAIRQLQDLGYGRDISRIESSSEKHEKRPLTPWEPANKGRKYPPEVLTADEVQRLLRAPSSRAPTGIRNKALLVVLYRSGLRISEALALMPKDVDRDAGTIRVLHGKGDKARTVGMDPEAFASLERWLDVRAAKGIKGKAPVFCTLKGGPLDSAYVRALLPRLASKAGIEKRVHAHGLRHTFAAELRAEGVDIGVISKQLGHSSLATTSVYLDHIAPAAVIETMRSRVWKDPK